MDQNFINHLERKNNVQKDGTAGTQELRKTGAQNPQVLEHQRNNKPTGTK